MKVLATTTAYNLDCLTSHNHPYTDLYLWQLSRGEWQPLLWQVRRHSYLTVSYNLLWYWSHALSVRMWQCLASLCRTHEIPPTLSYLYNKLEIMSSYTKHESVWECNGMTWTGGAISFQTMFNMRGLVETHHLYFFQAMIQTIKLWNIYAMPYSGGRVVIMNILQNSLQTCIMKGKQSFR